jgi:hypothetical protein
MKTIRINDFSGGIADNKFSTVANQFALGQGLNIDTPGLLTVNQALVNVGNTALKKAIRHASNYSRWAIGGATDGIYTINNTATTWSISHTTSSANKPKNIVGVKSSLIYASDTRLGMVNTPFNSTGYRDTVANLTSGFHPLLPKDDIVYIGNTNKIAKYDLSSFTDNLIPIENGYNIVDLLDSGNYILILLASAYHGLPSKIYWWDTYSEHYNYSLKLHFTGNALGTIEGSPVVIGKNDGSIYSISQTGVSLLEDKTLIDLDAVDYCNVSNGNIKAVEEFKGKLYYGITLAGNQTYPKGGVWSLGRSKPGGKIVKNWEWRIMDGTHTALLYSITNQHRVGTGSENIYICVNNSSTGTYKVCE